MTKTHIHIEQAAEQLAQTVIAATRHISESVPDGIIVGPVLMGMGNCAHIATPSITVRSLLNMAALTGMSVENYS